MRRALFLCPSPFEIGTYFRAFAIAKFLIQTGNYQIDLLCTGKIDFEKTIEGVRVIANAETGSKLAPMRGWNLRDILRRKRFIQNEKKYDFVYSFEYQPNVWSIASSVAKKDGAVHFNDWCDWYAGRHHKMKGIKLLQRFDAWMEEYPRSRVDHVTTICQSLYDRAKASGVKPENLSLLREGAEREWPLMSRAQAREKIGLSATERIVISMADLGHDILKSAIESWAKIDSNVKLVVLGKVTDLPTDHPHIHLPGRVSNEDLHAWLCAADLSWLCIPDNLISRGRLPHKIGHFRMYGLPLVTNPVGDVTDLKDEDIRFVTEDGKSFAEASREYGILSDETRRESVLHAEKIFSWDTLLHPLFQRIEKMITARENRKTG